MRHLLALPFLFPLLACATASAATVTLDRRCPADWPCVVGAHFAAAPGEANNLRVNVGTSIRFSDQGAPIEAPESCAREDEHTVTCQADELEIRLGDGDDRVAPHPPFPSGASRSARGSGCSAARSGPASATSKRRPPTRR